LGRLAHAVKIAGFRRHFEGWQLGALSVGIGLAFSWLAIARPSRPDVLPLPRVDPAEELRARVETRGLALRATTTQLPFDVRAVGEAIRRFGSAGARGDHALADAARNSARELAARAQKSGPAELLARLLAVQTELFVAAMRRWEAGTEPDADLRELGGDFLAKAKEKGWIAEGRLLLDEGELRALFKMRWLELTGLRELRPLTPSLNEWRIYYRLLLRLMDPADTDARRTAARKLGLVNALSVRDSKYEAALARGVLFYQLGSYDEAAQELRTHLADHPEGRWRLRARNYLLGVLEESGTLD
jgi:hypothetical protein